MHGRPPLPTGTPYAGRREDGAVLNITLDREAKELLQRWAPGKQMGALVARLIYEHQARQEERLRIARELLAGQTTPLG
jgi:hypothetical protein